MFSSTAQARSRANVALERACAHLMALQDEAGWWQGELQTNVTMDAEDMLLREFLGIRRAEETARSAAWIRSQQRPDGTWANFHGGPGELSTTIEAYWGLRLAGDPPETWQTVQRLAALGYDWHNIMHMIAAVVSDDVYHVLKEDRRFDPADYTRRLHELPGDWPPP